MEYDLTFKTKRLFGKQSEIRQNDASNPPLRISDRLYIILQ